MAVAKDKEKAAASNADAVVRRQAAAAAAGGGDAQRKTREQNENRLVRLVRETRAELRRVVWPTREETTRLTVVVIAISVVVGLILFTADSPFLSLYTLLLSLFS
jgi:preprotein translocase subunit SecE